jgi:membrane-anchored protein YejM (alkaline phosphatase superfamily)
LYAYGDLFNKVTITRNAKLLPLYQPLTIKRFAADVLNIQVNREADLKISSDRSILNYPKRDLRCEPTLNKGPNILMIVVDGLRFDMLTEETMPNTWEFSKKSIVYENHYSGGNGTRFGIFSLLYGIQGTYWHNFLAQRQSPVLIDTLIDHGYDFRILSSTRLTFPEFRKTAFLKIPDTITDTFNIGDASARDRIITDELIDFMSQRDNAKPFFAFVFYDAPHQPYLYPDNFEKFKPVSNKEINYFKDIGRERIHLLRNRYKNAVFFDDSLIGDILTSLKALDRLDDTLVIITGDHGEEFYESGYFGHTSAFNDYQLKTVFIMHVPNNGNLIVTRLTSHHDVVPTILQSLGCTSPDEDYSQGISLLHEGHHTYITASKWDKSAIIDDDHVIAFSTELYNLGNLEIRSKSDYSEVEDSRALIKKKKGLLIDVSRKMSEFYK